MRIKHLIDKARDKGFSITVSESGHTTISKGQKSITIWEDKTILRNDIPFDQCLKMRVYEAAQYLALA